MQVRYVASTNPPFDNQPMGLYRNCWIHVDPSNSLRQQNGLFPLHGAIGNRWTSLVKCEIHMEVQGAKGCTLYSSSLPTLKVLKKCLQTSYTMQVAFLACIYTLCVQQEWFGGLLKHQNLEKLLLYSKWQYFFSKTRGLTALVDWKIRYFNYN